MPLTVEEYHIGQLFMIAKHCAEQSHGGEGVEVMENRAHVDPVHGKGQYTEKRIHLSSRLPTWLQSFVPRLFYITEEAWNYYPYTISKYTCSFVPRFSVTIKTKYENNNGSSENCLDLPAATLAVLEVDFVDILTDAVSPHHYKPAEDPATFKSVKTGRGPLAAGWRDCHEPIMCSYKVIEVSLDVWGIGSRVEEFAHKAVREIQVGAHRQAFAWIDDWYEMSIDDVRAFEQRMQQETNEKLKAQQPKPSPSPSPSASGSTTPTSPLPKKGWFQWS